MPEGDIYQADLEFQLDGRTISFSQYLHQDDSSTATPQEIATALAPLVVTQVWSDWWQNFASNVLLFENVRVQMIYPTREIFIIDDTDAGGGTQIGDAMVAFNAVLVAEYAQRWGRRWTGRVFLPGLPEDDETLGRVNGPTLAGIQAGAPAALTDVISPGPPVNASFTPSIFSRQQVKDGLTPVSSPVANVFVREDVTSQVRRKRHAA